MPASLLKTKELHHPIGYSAVTDSMNSYRMSPQSLSETTVIAFTVGAAVLATLHWIQDLRSRLSNNSSTASPTSTSQPWASPGGKTTTTATTIASPSSVITSPGASTPTGRDSPTATNSKDRAQLVLLKGKQGRSESSPAAIEQAVSSLLTATNVPHAVSQTPQVFFCGSLPIKEN